MSTPIPQSIDKRDRRTHARLGAPTLLTHVAPVALILGGLFALGGAAGATPATVGMGNAASFAVLAGSTVTNTGSSVIAGDVGVSPGTSVTGFPPGTVAPGSVHLNDQVAINAQTSATAAYNDAAGRTPATPIVGSLGGQTLVPGVYSGGAAAMTLTGTLTLNGGADPNAVFIFQASSTLITSPGSVVALINVSPCNVFWQVTSSATLDTTSTFVGTVMALASITVNNGAHIAGRLLAQTGAVTLINDTVDAANCAAATTAPTAAPTTTSAAPTTTTTVASTSTTAAPSSTTSTAAPVRSTATPGGSTPGGATPAASGPAGGGLVSTGPGTTAAGPATSTNTTGPAATATATRTGTGLPFTGLRATTLGIAGLAAILLGTVLLLAARRPTGSHYIE